MIIAGQLRAARSLLNLNQQAVSDGSGVGLMTISDVENERTQAKASTLDALRRFYESRGIEFTLDGGIRPKVNAIQIFEGSDCYMDFMNEVHALLAPLKGEVLFSGSDERRSPPAIIEKFRAMRADGVRMRSLIKSGDDYVMGALEEYRWMPDNLFVDGDVKIIFADRVAWLASWLDVPRVIMIIDPTIAREAIRTFEHLWGEGQSPKETTAPETY